MSIWPPVIPGLWFLWHKACLGLPSTAGALPLPVSPGDKGGNLNARQSKDSALQLPRVLLFWEGKGVVPRRDLAEIQVPGIGKPF